MVKKQRTTHFVTQLMRSLPPGTSVLRDDIEKHLKARLQGLLSQCELVTREEFDVQRAVLKRTREKLDAIEAQLEQLVTLSEKKDT